MITYSVDQAYHICGNGQKLPAVPSQQATGPSGAFFLSSNPASSDDGRPQITNITRFSKLARSMLISKTDSKHDALSSVVPGASGPRIF